MKSKLHLLSDDTTRHSVFNLNYKIIFKALNSSIINKQASYLFKETAKRLGLAYHTKLTGWNWSANRIEMRIHCYSLLLVRQFAEKFKQISSSDYHHIIEPRNHNSIWRPGFCLITVSSHSKKTVNNYLAK